MVNGSLTLSVIEHDANLLRQSCLNHLQMSILSIQSFVSYGRVGNRAASFALERLGHEVWPINTVTFSNHPAFGSHKGGIHHPDDIRDIVSELEARGALERCRAVISGYLGDPKTGEALLEVVDKVRRANPEALFILDPVMGEKDGGAYVPEALQEFYKDQAAARADVLMPNAWELSYLTGEEFDDVDAAANAAKKLLELGPSAVVVSGIRHDDEVSVLLVAGDQAFQATTPYVDVKSHGAGDLFAAMFLGNYLNRGDARWAVARAMSATYGILRRTKESEADSLAIVPGQREIISPTERVAALPLWATP